MSSVRGVWLLHLGAVRPHSSGLTRSSQHPVALSFVQPEYGPAPVESVGWPAPPGHEAVNQLETHARVRRSHIVQIRRYRLTRPCVRRANVVKILLQPSGERGVVLLIVAATGKKDVGNQVIGAVLASRVGSGEAVCPGGTPLRICGARLGEHLKKCAADT